MDDLPTTTAFSSSDDVSFALSSNFMNSVIWLIDDADLLSIEVTNAMLGDNPPILLNTTNLSILLPKLKTDEWANKGNTYPIHRGLPANQSINQILTPPPSQRSTRNRCQSFCQIRGEHNWA
jgi:hypothetical protein